MSGQAVALVLMAAVFHASWNLLAKREGGGATLVWMFGVAGSIVQAPAALVSLRRWGEPIDGLVVVVVAGSAVVHALYFLLLQRAYAVGDLSIVYPVSRGTGPLLTALVAVTVLGEGMTPAAGLGVALLIGGIGGLSGISRRALTSATSTLYGLATGVTVAAYTLWDRWAVAGVEIPPVAYLWMFTAGYAVLLTPVMLPSLRRRRPTRAAWRAALAIAVLSAGSYITVLSVLRDNPVSLVAPLREVSILVAALLGWRILGEPMTTRKLVSGATILAGVALIAAG